MQKVPSLDIPNSAGPGRTRAEGVINLPDVQYVVLFQIHTIIGGTTVNGMLTQIKI